ncbi:MAG: cyclic dehypoxanthinyl futalosine synthase [Desulfovibrionaceae bacterium]
MVANPCTTNIYSSVESITQDVLEGRRISKDEALLLYQDASLYTLAFLANTIKQKKHPEPYVTYVADRNINYTNVCVTGCRFCAFYRTEKHPESYVLSIEEIASKIQETIDLGGTQILLQGGHHPNLAFSYYEELLSYIRSTFPTIHTHAFSAPEILFFAKNENTSVADIISRLIKAGLHSIPGAGAEILVDSVREKIAPLKCSTNSWINTMRIAHNLGLRTTATMMFGHGENLEDRITHLYELQNLQDETHGFTAFIPWTFQPENTKIDCFTAPSPEYLRTVAISRIVLDNIDNIQASWVTMGPHIAQLSLSFGVNDFGSLMIEENVVSAAGVSFLLSREEIHALIEGAGFIPKQRTMFYDYIE